jgi:glucose/arabinose dehydrogenase
MRVILTIFVIGVMILLIPEALLTHHVSLSHKSPLGGPDKVLAQSDEPVLRFSNDVSNPIINVPGLSTEVVAEGLELPTTMAFLSQDDILVLEKDKGTVRRIVEGQLQPEPMLDVNVATDVERCMCGIAVSRDNSTGKTNVFLYYTEAEGADGGTPIANRLYRYEVVGQPGAAPNNPNSSAASEKLGNPQLLLDLPVLPGPRHNGGAIIVGPDGNVYVPIGDTDKTEQDTEAQNGPDLPADGTSGILRVTQDGKPVIDPSTGEYILGDSYPLNLYYAYGIRNSFGIDFDPVTGNLWDTENGPGYGDEINLVRPGFNSGWNQVVGIWARGGGDPREGESIVAPEQPDTLFNFNGRGAYHPPQLTWLHTVGPTAIKFLNSDSYGPGLRNDLFVGDVHGGNIYQFKLNEDRTELILPPPLDDKLADTEQEALVKGVIFGTAFAGISDMEVSPYDGFMYIVSLGQGKIFKLVPTGGPIGGGVGPDTSGQTTPNTPVGSEDTGTVNDETDNVPIDADDGDNESDGGIGDNTDDDNNNNNGDD